MQKTFPNHQQTSVDNACGQMCLLNIYDYFGYADAAKKLSESLDLSKNNVSFTPQLALQLHKNSLETILLTCNSQLIEYNWKSKSTKQVLDLLKQWILTHNEHPWSTGARKLEEYLEGGGALLIENITSSIIDRYINEGYVALVCLDEAWLWGQRKVDKIQKFDPIFGKTNGHFVVVYAQNGNSYSISDPYPTLLPNKNGLYKVPKETLVASSLMWDPEIVLVRKNKVLENII